MLLRLQHGRRSGALFPDCRARLSSTSRHLDTFQEAHCAKSLPTYQWLSDAGITPDSDTTYTLEQLTSALQQSAGVRTFAFPRYLLMILSQVKPEFECSGKVSVIIPVGVGPTPNADRVCRTSTRFSGTSILKAHYTTAS